MKRFYVIMTAIVFALICVFSYNKYTVSEKNASATSISSRRTVVIDAGHGGKDAGTIGIDGTQEKKINLEIAKILFDYLMVSGINAVLIRSDDSEYYPDGSDTSKSDLYNRLDFVNSITDSILISIHQNHFENESQWGTQIWYSANTPQSKTIADSVLSNIKELMQPENERENKVSDSSYYLLFKASVPSVMIECGFMSNSEENAKLRDANYQKNMAYSILTGICSQV